MNLYKIKYGTDNRSIQTMIEAKNLKEARIKAILYMEYYDNSTLHKNLKITRIYKK